MCHVFEIGEFLQLSVELQHAETQSNSKSKSFSIHYNDPDRKYTECEIIFY